MNRRPTLRVQPPPSPLTERAGPRQRVLLAEADAQAALDDARALRMSGLEVEVNLDAHTARRRLEDMPFDLVILDQTLADMDEVDLMGAVRDLDPDLPFIVLCAAPSLHTSVRLAIAGAARNLSKPVAPSDLASAAHHAIEAAQQTRHMRTARTEPPLFATTLRPKKNAFR